MKNEAKKNIDGKRKVDGLVGIMDTNTESKTKETLCITFQTYWPFVEISRKEQLDLARQPRLRIG